MKAAAEASCSTHRAMESSSSRQAARKQPAQQPEESHSRRGEDAPPSGIHGFLYPRQSRTDSRLALTCGGSVRSTLDSCCTPAGLEQHVAAEVGSEVSGSGHGGSPLRHPSEHSHSHSSPPLCHQAPSPSAHCRSPRRPPPCARARAPRAPRTRTRRSRGASTCRRRARAGTRSTGQSVAGVVGGRGWGWEEYSQ